MFSCYIILFSTLKLTFEHTVQIYIIYTNICNVRQNNDAQVCECSINNLAVVRLEPVTFYLLVQNPKY